MSRQGALLLSLALVIVAQGCVIPVPVPLPQRTVSGRRITAETLTSITPGVTTKAEVIGLLGEPYVFWEDERVLGYYWMTYQGEVLIFLIVPGGGGGGSIPSHERHILLLQLNQHDNVKRMERTTGTLSDAYRQYVVKWREQAE